MADRIIQTETLTDIADAIRAKTGKSAAMTPLAMPSEIGSIQTGGASPSGAISITDNGTKDVTNYASANVNVSAATAFGAHNGWRIAKFHTISADIGNGATCTIDTGIVATRYMLICMSVKSRSTWGLQAAHFSVNSYETAGALCLKPSTGQMYCSSAGYINGVSLSGTTLSFTVANANATVKAGEYLILYQP